MQSLTAMHPTRSADVSEHSQSPPRKRRSFAVAQLIARLRQLVRRHEDHSVRLVVATHVIMVGLDLTDRATYQTVRHPLLSVWVDSPAWVVAGTACVVWLMVWNRPPKVIWGLWVSTAVLSGWGVVNLLIGLAAPHPVSLLGPALILFVAAPLAWASADAFQERMQQEAHDKVSEGSRDRSGG